MEPLSAIFTVFGIVFLTISWLLLLQVSFETDFNWGLATLFVPPLSYFYGLFAWEKAKESVGLAVLGWVLIFLA